MTPQTEHPDPERVRSLIQDVDEQFEATIGAVDDGSETGFEFDDGERQELRKPIGEIREFLEHASPDAILRSVGIESDENVAPTDLPRIVAEMSSEDVVDLRTLFELGSIEDEWEGLDDVVLAQRLEQVISLSAEDIENEAEPTDMSGVAEFIETVSSQDDQTEANDTDSESGDASEERSEDDTALESFSERIRASLDSFGDGSDADEDDGSEPTSTEESEESEKSEESEESTTDGTTRRRRYSTVPSSDRADLTAVARFRTMRR